MSTTHASEFLPQDTSYEQRVRDSFRLQRFMGLLGAELESVKPGAVTIALPFRADLTQQHGYLHAATIAAIADSSCGYAALTLAPADSAVLSAEFKINLLAPAAGRRFTAHGRVVKAGRTLIITIADVFAESEEGARPVALMTATIMVTRGRGISN